MQETFIVTVQTEGGKFLIHEKITGDYYSLFYLLSQLSNRFMSHLEEISDLETGPGHGIGPSALDS